MYAAEEGLLTKRTMKCYPVRCCPIVIRLLGLVCGFVVDWLCVRVEVKMELPGSQRRLRLANKCWPERLGQGQGPVCPSGLVCKTQHASG